MATAAAPARPATLPPASHQAALPALPGRLAAELIHALAGLALGGP